MDARALHVDVLGRSTDLELAGIDVENLTSRARDRGTAGHRRLVVTIQTIIAMPDGTMFGARYDLYTIDPATGSYSIIGGGSYPDVRGADFTGPFPNQIFPDGFESGDTSAWSSTYPSEVYLFDGGGSDDALGGRVGTDLMCATAVAGYPGIPSAHVRAFIEGATYTFVDLSAPE